MSQSSCFGIIIANASVRCLSLVFLNISFPCHPSLLETYSTFLETSLTFLESFLASSDARDMGQNPPASQACQEKRWGSGGVQRARSSAQACGGGVKDLVRDAEVLGPPGKCLCIPFTLTLTLAMPFCLSPSWVPQ